MSDRPYRVVLVEDNDDDADLVARGVSKYHGRVEFTRIVTIPGAIQFLVEWQKTKQTPDLVLLDGRVEGLEATEFFERASAAGLRDLQCVVLTGSVDSMSAKHLVGMGARQVTWKPVDYSEFLAEIARILDQYSPSEASVNDQVVEEQKK